MLSEDEVLQLIERERHLAQLLDNDAGRAALQAELAATQAALATRTDQLQAMKADRDDWRDKAVAFRALVDVQAPEEDEDPAIPSIFRLGRRIAQALVARDEAIAERGELAAQLSDAVRERDVAQMAARGDVVGLVEQIKAYSRMFDQR